MYVILVYDINETRVNAVNAYLKRFLHWVQNSVFEGELDVKTFKKMENGLKKIINKREDSIIMYVLPSDKIALRKHIGVIKNMPKFFV